MLHAVLLPLLIFFDILHHGPPVLARGLHRRLGAEEEQHLGEELLVENPEDGGE